MKFMARRMVILGLLVVWGLWVIGCDVAPPPVFDPMLIQQSERASAANVSPIPMSPLPTTRQDPYVGARGLGDSKPTSRPTTGPDFDDDPIVHMSLQEIIHRAVANNHDVKVAGYEPAIQGARVMESRGQFDPVFYVTAQYQQKNDLNGGEIFNSFTGGPLIITNVNDEDLGTIQTGLQENLGSGGQIQLQYETIYTWFRPQQTLFNPFYQNDLTLSLTQPLLRNFGSDVNHAQITINRMNQKISLLDFRKAVEQNAFDIEQAYWQLVQAVRDVEVHQDLVEQNIGNYQILSTRMKQRLDVSQLQVSQAQTELESARAQLVQFKSQARDLSDKLKGLMSDPEFPIAASTMILPADKPVEDPLVFDLQDQIDSAMENRFELGEEQLKVDEATVTISVARNNLLPQFDFIGSVGPEGAAATPGAAVTAAADFTHIDFSAGFKLQIPIGNRQARGIWKRTVLQRMEEVERYRGLVESISVEIKTDVRAVGTTWNVIRASRRARFAAEDALNAINARERANEPLTPEFVQLKLDTQDRLASAQEAEAEAISNYNIALAQLERAKGTLLRYNNVLLEEDTARAEENGMLR